MQKAAWIAVDWGTSHLRAWAMDAAGAPMAERRSTRGMNTLEPCDFEAALMELIAVDLPEQGQVPVICCGMAGARQGWAEAGYRVVPCAPQTPSGAARFETHEGRLAVSILPGVSQKAPPDVMRGEETQIAGFLAVQPDFDGVVCLPGTHTKWAHISAGEIVSFQTYMTGELFALLSETSVLRHSVRSSDIDETAFEDAIGNALSRPQSIGATLFGLRAASLVAELPPPKARAALSGSLIGLELAGARPYWLGQNVALIGDGALTQLYQRALSLQGVSARMWDATDMTLSGLRSAYALLEGPK